LIPHKAGENGRSFSGGFYHIPVFSLILLTA